jgi:RNA polymerase sigma factor (sigma-70 family)
MPKGVIQLWHPNCTHWQEMSESIHICLAEESLIDGALSGRPGAFGDLVQPYLAALTRFARSRVGDVSAAEDVVQQAVFLAFGNLQQYRREASFKTWLSAIVSNEAKHWRRGQRVVQIRPLNEAYVANLADPGGSPDTQCEVNEDAERLREAIVRLPEKYRQMIQLRDLRELSVAETARSLSLTAGAVKTRHHRARRLLMRRLTRKTPGAISGARSAA